jgi:soluble lytic murein transglycosylase-like protein
MTRSIGLILCGAVVCYGQAFLGIPEFRDLTTKMQWANHYAVQYRVPFEFVAAIIDVESDWQPYVVSSKGAAGLMQLMPATAYRFGVRNRFRIEENLNGGVAYIAFLIERFRDLRLVAAAYYTGERRIDKVGLKCADPDVFRYVSVVQRAFSEPVGKE